MKIRPNPKKVADPAPDCPLNDCLNLMAGAWTAEVIWYLQKEPRRFGDLQRDLAGVSSKVLTSRLRELEERGVVARAVFPTKPPTVEYSLTAIGRRLLPVLDAVVEVGKDLRKRGEVSRRPIVKKRTSFA
ncbi:MAG: winged helix-turn-helix transcriptional regulator [Bacteriovoracia bacterium]